MRGIGIILSIVILASAFLSRFMAVRTTTFEVDAISGQVRQSNVWIGGHRSTSVESSELADHLRILKIAWTPDWRTINVNEYNVLGSATSRGCSLAPPIYQLQPVLMQFARASSAAELRAFVDVMRKGSESEQRRAVDCAADCGLNALATARSDQ